MDDLDPQQFADLHAALRQRRQALVSQLAGGAPEAEEVQTSPEDNASNRTLHQLQRGASDHQLAQLRAVTRALAKFDDGSYGLCENCGQPIGHSRLRARPEATLCIACQTRFEQQRHP